jgi:hypothetical protein
MNIGVVVTTCDRPEAVLNRARASVGSVPMVVVNDGCTEVSDALRTPRPYSGPSCGRNIGFEYLSQQGVTHVVCLDDDDWLAPNWLRYFKAGYRHPSVDRLTVFAATHKLVYENWEEGLSTEAEEWRSYASWEEPSVVPARGRTGKLPKLLTGTESMTVSACCPVELWRKVGGWPDSHVEDHLFWIRVLREASKVAQYVNCSPVLYYSQRPSGQRTDEMSDGSTRYWDAMIDNSEEILDELSPQELGSVLSTIFNKGVIPKGRSRDFFLRIAERNLDLCVR